MTERYVGLRPGCLIVSLGDHQSLCFDRAGRWFTAQLEENAYRRGLDNRVRCRPRDERAANLLAPSAALALWERIQQATQQAHEDWQGGALPALDDADPEAVREVFGRALSWNAARYKAEAETFDRLYGRVPILPPDQYQAIYLQVNRGCRYNRCTFCDFYQGVPYHELNDGEFERHMGQVRELLGDGISLRRGLFLGDASALSLEHDMLIRRLEQIREVFGQQADRVGAFTAAHDQLRTPAQFSELAALGLKRLAIGLETGSEAVRKRLRKPGSNERYRKMVAAAREGGVGISVILMAGIGDADHLKETTEALESMGLESQDIVYISPLIGPMASREAPLQADQLRASVRALPGKPRCSVYHVSGFVY